MSSTALPCRFCHCGCWYFNLEYTRAADRPEAVASQEAEGQSEGGGGGRGAQGDILNAGQLGPRAPVSGSLIGTRDRA